MAPSVVALVHGSGIATGGYSDFIAA
jgi:hypothetical protein